MKTYTLFTILDATTKEVVYVGITTVSAEKRLGDLMEGAKSSTTAQYRQKISEWLRNQRAEFKTPAYHIEGTFESLEEATLVKAEIMKAHPTILNIKHPLAFKKV